MQQLIRLPGRVYSALRSRGVAGLTRRAWFLASTWLRERRLGIRTEQTIPWHELSDDADSVDYEASGYRTLRRALSLVELGRQDVFLDLGCGLGRPLVMAARHPVRRVIGVELSAELCEAARENLQRAANLRCGSWRVECAAAGQYEIPDEVSVLYMFNPFRGETLRTVIEQLRLSLARAPRQFTLLYVLPQAQDDPLANASWLTKLHDEPSEGLRLVVYRAATTAG